jgi:hypothetical protein
VREIEQSVPAHLGRWWTRDLWSLHSAAWWRRHWERSGILDILEADTLPGGWRLWLDWLEHVAPDNAAEREALASDAGEYLGYVRVVGRRRDDIELAEPIVSVPTQYARRPLLRSDG